MRIAFMGTPDFAVPALEALIAAGHQVAAVYSQPPRPAGRGHKLAAVPVHLCAERHGIQVRTPQSLRIAEAQADFAALDLDLAVVAAYGLILPQAILEAPRRGCLNIHASLLPRWRGAAPIQRALLAGDTETGITIMQMDAGLDTGDMLLRESLPITPKSTTPALHDALAAMGARLIVQALDRIDDLVPQKQDEKRVTYAEKLNRNESIIQWAQAASDIERKVRAFTPWPGTCFLFGDERIKLLEATLIEAEGQHGQPGEILDTDLTLACGEGALRLDQVQRAGKSPCSGRAFLCGSSLKSGDVLA